MLEKESCLQQIKIQQLEGEGETEPGSEEVCGGWKISSRSRLEQLKRLGSKLASGPHQFPFWGGAPVGRTLA